MPVRSRPHLVHRIVATLVMLGGIFDLIDSLYTRHPLRLSFLAELLPLEVHYGSRALLVLSGLVLISLGRGLGRGKRRAWQLALGFAILSFLLHLVRNNHPIFTLPPLLLLLYLVLSRRFFVAGSDPASTRRSLLLAPALFMGLVTYGSLGQYHLRHTIEPSFRTVQALQVTLRAAVGSSQLGVNPLTPHAREFLDSIAWLSVGSSVLLVWLLLRPVIIRRLNPALGMAQSVIAQYGDHSLAPFAAEPDKHHFLGAGGRAAIAYRVINGVAVTVGDPIGPHEDLDDSVDDFLAHCRRHDWVPCFYEVRSQNLDVYRRQGLRTLKIAEEAAIVLVDFSLRGAKMQKLRQSMNKIEREHPLLKVEVSRGVTPNGILEQLQEISAQWLQAKGVSELGFTMGRFDPAILARQKLAVATEDCRVLGFVSWRPFAGRGWALDLMRYTSDAPKFLMDYLIVKSLLQFQQDGDLVASLANAPLANVSPQDELTMLDRGVRLIFENVHGIYEFKSLFQFKKKFNPTWEGRYLAFPSLESLPRIAVAMMRVHRQRPIQRTLFLGS